MCWKTIVKAQEIIIKHKQKITRSIVFPSQGTFSMLLALRNETFFQ